MDPKRYQLYINGKSHQTRGLDLAFNPHNGNVLGKVVLISESLLQEKSGDEREDTVRIAAEDLDPKMSS